MNEHIKTITSWLGAGSINIFGRPFAGKDTQGEVIAEKLNGELIAGGDILRSYHNQEKIKQIMSTGDLFPTDLYLEIVLPYLSRQEIKSKPLILSSVGRLKGEESIIMKATEESGHPIKVVVDLKLTEEDVWQRFKESQKQHDRGNRADDHKNVLKNRLKKFQEKTIPVIDFYKDKGFVIEVDGTLPREEVTNQIIEKLIKFAANN